MLEVENLRAGYGAINVLWDVSLTMPAGKVTAVIGPNGAGKTTLLRTIMGLLPINRGRIRLNQNALNARKTWEIVALGLGMVPEGRLIFKDMTVEENLIMGAYLKPHRRTLKQRLEGVYGLFPHLKDRSHQMADSLSGGEAQMLAMGRGLMPDPQILLIDEPSLGLAPLIVREVFDVIARLKEEGRTIMLVEQNTHMALSVADHVCLLSSGKVRFSKPAKEVDMDQLHHHYFAR